MKTATPWPEDAQTMRRPVCDRQFVCSGRRRYCCGGCRRKVWARHHSPATLLVVPAPVVSRRAVTVYERGCAERALGVQRCDSCGGFMRRVDLGGGCPCDAPVAAAELIEVVGTLRRRSR